MRLATVMGPQQAGKTTLVAALATLDSGKPGRLALCGEAAATRFSYMGDDWGLIDIPGGADGMALAGPALAASDAVVICVPAEADAAVLAAPYLRLAEEAGLPTFLFVNRIDAATDRVADIVAAMQIYCAHAMVLRQVPMREDGRITGAVDLISERAWAYHDGTRSSLVELPDSMRAREEEARAELLEHLADFDDALLEQLIEDKKPLTGEVYDVATKVLRHHDLVPVLLGAASHGNGVQRLMKSLRHEVPGVSVLAKRNPQALAIGALADSVKHLGKIVLVRALGDGVAAGATLGGGTIGSIVDLDQRTPLHSLEPGHIGLTVKTDHLSLGAPIYSETGAHAAPDWAAAHAFNHARIVEPSNARDETRLSSALARLAEIDPGLEVTQDPETGKSVAGAQGPVHLRRIVASLADVFGVEVTTAEIPPAYCETPARRTETHHRHRKQSGGAGQFADVLISVAPLKRGTGERFAEEIKGGAVPKSYIPAVEAGAREALAEGPNGYHVVDISITLKDGKHHAVDSSDFAFRTAGKNAVRAALIEAGTRILQPISLVTIHVPSPFSGGLVPLTSGLKGHVLGFEAHPTAAGWDVFRAHVPKAVEDDLFAAPASTARGTAWYRSDLDHYEEVRDRQPAAVMQA